MNKYLVKRSIVTFNLPYTINLPDDLYVVNLGEVVATISLKKKATRDNRSVLHSISFPNDSYVLGDRWGRFGYTNATIQFDHPISIKYHVMLQDYLLELSVRSINRILDVCRSTKGDHYIRINRSDLFSYNVRFIDINDGLIPGDVLGIINNSIVSMGRAGNPSASQLVTKIDFWSSQKYKDWKQYSYNVRNDVVHRGKSVSSYESKIAVETNSEAIKFIASLA